MSHKSRANGFLLHDLFLIAVSIIVAVTLVRTEVLEHVLTAAQGIHYLGSFVAGLFFTSIFTTAPAVVALGEIMQVHSIVPVALIGAAGAVIGDLVIFRFIRDRFAEHLLELVGHKSTVRRVHALFKLRLFRWLSLFVGGLIIASPLPDELGISLFGFSKLSTSWFIPLSFTFNFIGIMIIGTVVRAL